MELTLEQKQHFLDAGYLRVPNMFTADEVQRMRASVSEVFARPASRDGDYDGRAALGSVRFDVFNRNPTLQWVPCHPRLISVMKSLLGNDFVMLPEMSAHRSGFGDWHKDTTAQERAGHLFQWSPTFAMVEAAIYLQDNGEWGGGLDVIPGSQRKPDTYAYGRSVLEDVRARLERRHLLPFGRGVTVPSRAGDLVIFDFRLDHKASWPKRRGTPPTGYEKYALFIACSANNEHVRRYVEYISARPEYAYMRERSHSTELKQRVRASGATLFDASAQAP